MIYETPYVLDRAAELLEESGWCQGWYAVNENGACVDWDSKHAVKFCAQAAIFRCEGADRDVEKFEKFIGMKIHEFNDKIAICKEEVIEKFLDCSSFLRGSK